MPIHHAIWQVGQPVLQLKPSKLSSEALLEQMIVQDPAILSPAWMLVGQQETTSHGGRIDLLAIAPDGSLVLVELKRDRTPREMVAQALDDASWGPDWGPTALEGRVWRRPREANLPTDCLQVAQKQQSPTLRVGLSA